jgi:hypothetical protein
VTPGDTEAINDIYTMFVVSMIMASVFAIPAIIAASCVMPPVWRPCEAGQ